MSEQSPRPEPYSSADDRDRRMRSVAATRFVRAIEAWQPKSSDGVEEEVRSAACAFVDELKTQDMPPEQVLVAIKDLLHDVAGERDNDGQRQLVQKVVSWCISAYYDLG